MKCARIKLTLLANDYSLCFPTQRIVILFIVHNKADFCVELKIQNTCAKLSYKIELEKNQLLRVENMEKKIQQSD